jgi:hypothetical protein
MKKVLLVPFVQAFVCGIACVKGFVVSEAQEQFLNFIDEIKSSIIPVKLTFVSSHKKTAPSSADESAVCI